MSGWLGIQAGRAGGQASLWQPLFLLCTEHRECIEPCTSLPTTCSGQFAEVLNLAPWGGVSLQFRHLRLFGMQGVAGLGESPPLDRSIRPFAVPGRLPVVGMM